jgi:hypothetical protein
VLAHSAQTPLGINRLQSPTADLRRAQTSITGFLWFDLRHHFASRLIQRGVPLNTAGAC